MQAVWISVCTTNTIQRKMSWGIWLGGTLQPCVRFLIGNECQQAQQVSGGTGGLVRAESTGVQAHSCTEGQRGDRVKHGAGGFDNREACGDLRPC